MGPEDLRKGRGDGPAGAGSTSPGQAPGWPRTRGTQTPSHVVWGALTHPGDPRTQLARGPGAHPSVKAQDPPRPTSLWAHRWGGARVARSTGHLGALSPDAPCSGRGRDTTCRPIHPSPRPWAAPGMLRLRGPAHWSPKLCRWEALSGDPSQTRLPDCEAPATPRLPVHRPRLCPQAVCRDGDSVRLLSGRTPSALRQGAGGSPRRGLCTHISGAVPTN